MSKTTVIYRDIAVGAEADAAVSAIGATAESRVESLPSGVNCGKVVTLEHNRWALDGSFAVLYEDTALALWSDQLSDKDGVFETTPSILIQFTQRFSSMGISLLFDEASGEYCSKVNIRWFRGEEVKAERNFEPDAVSYFCAERVEGYDRIEIVLQKTSLPYRRAKLNRIVFGVVRTFSMNELRNASIVNQSDESTIELPVSTFQWTLDSRDTTDYLFQLKQPVEVVNDNRTLGVFYIDGSHRKSANVYKIECKDAIGALSDVPYSGVACINGVSAKALLSEIAFPFEVEYEADVADATLFGVIENGTARSAIQQVAFAWGVCVATDGGEKLRVYSLPTAEKSISKDRTFTGASVKTSPVVTKVEVVAHTYVEDANGTVEVAGKRYSDTQAVYSVSNQNLTTTDKKNEKTIKGGTLVSPAIAQETAQRVYDYFSKRDLIAAKVVYDGERLGDCVRICTPWDTTMTGNISKMEISLSNTVVYGVEANVL